MVRSPDLGTEIGLALDLRVRDETLRPNGDAFLDDRALDLGSEADANRVSDPRRAPNHREVADQAVIPNLNRPLHEHTVANPRPGADDDRPSRRVENGCLRDMGVWIDA